MNVAPCLCHVIFLHQVTKEEQKWTEGQIHDDVCHLSTGVFVFVSMCSSSWFEWYCIFCRYLVESSKIMCELAMNHTINGFVRPESV